MAMHKLVLDFIMMMQLMCSACCWLNRLQAHMSRIPKTEAQTVSCCSLVRVLNVMHLQNPAVQVLQPCCWPATGVAYAANACNAKSRRQNCAYHPVSQLHAGLRCTGSCLQLAASFCLTVAPARHARQVAVAVAAIAPVEGFGPLHREAPPAAITVVAWLQENCQTVLHCLYTARHACHCRGLAPAACGQPA